jgi:hypothetical protein
MEPSAEAFCAAVREDCSDKEGSSELRIRAHQRASGKER